MVAQLQIFDKSLKFFILINDMIWVFLLQLFIRILTVLVYVFVMFITSYEFVMITIRADGNMYNIFIIYVYIKSTFPLLLKNKMIFSTEKLTFLQFFFFS